MIILFDIDGTLVEGDGAGRRAMERGMAKVLDDLGLPSSEGRAFAGLRFGGATDRALVRRALERLGVAADEALMTLVFEAYLAALADELAAGKPFRPLPGALAAATALAAHGVVGVGTGNIEAAAWLKLEVCGLRAAFGFGGYGSDAEDRADLLRIGVARGAAVLGRAADVVVIGDTVRDVAAGLAIGARVVAVTTGGDPAESLVGAGAHQVLTTLADIDGVVWAATGR